MRGISGPPISPWPGTISVTPAGITKGGWQGIGVSYGYAWLLSKRWNLSVEAGVGLYYMKDRKRDHCVPWTADEYIGHNRRLVLGPSKCEVAFTYLF